MLTAYSVRSRKPPEILKYEITERCRDRVLAGFATLCAQRDGTFQRLLRDVAKRCGLQYGGLRVAPSFVVVANEPIESRTISHFRVCSTDEAIDFIEWCFQSEGFHSDWCETGVYFINKVFREEGIGYELSPYVVTKSEPDAYGNVTTDIQYPEAIKKSNEIVHQSTVMPALQLLSGSIWSVANKEMLQAHESLRHGKFDDAINAAGRCLESVLKTICDKNGWKFVADKDTLNPLLQACYKNKLFPSPYIEVFQKSSGEIRNKWAGHGQGPKPPHGLANQAMAEHMIHVTSAHIIFLAKSAGVMK